MIITAGKFKGRNITAPPENITRPTLSKVRMSVFNTLQTIIEFEGKSFLDMFAGSGIMGLEALSRGFTQVTAIEKNPKAYKILKANYGILSLRGRNEVNDVVISSEMKWDCDAKSRHRFAVLLPFTREAAARNEIKTISGDSLKITPKLEKFDVIYIDPPYFAGIYENSLQAVKEISGGIVILEHVTDVDFQDFEVIKQKKYGDKFITFLSK